MGSKQLISPPLKEGDNTVFLSPRTPHHPIRSAAERRPARRQDPCTPVRRHGERDKELGPSLSSWHRQAGGRKIPGADTWVSKVKRREKAARRIHNPGDGGWGGGQSGESPQSEWRPAGAPEGRPLLRSEVKQTVLRILPVPAAPLENSFLSCTKLYARVCSLLGRRRRGKG